MTPLEKIAILRSIGFQIRVGHFRPIKGADPKILLSRTAVREALILDGVKYEFLATGGMTEVEIGWEGETIGGGLAICSKKDNFCYKTGLAYALDRAVFSTVVTIGNVTRGQMR